MENLQIKEPIFILAVEDNSNFQTTIKKTVERLITQGHDIELIITGFRNEAEEIITSGRKINIGLFDHCLKDGCGGNTDGLITLAKEVGNIDEIHSISRDEESQYNHKLEGADGIIGKYNIVTALCNHHLFKKQKENQAS